MRMSGQPTRPDFLPPPLAVEERTRSRSSQGYDTRGACGAGGHGDLLGPLSFPVSYGPGDYGGQLGFSYANGNGKEERVPGQEVVQPGTPNPVVMNLFPDEGHGDGRALRQGDEVAGVPPLAMSPVPTVLAMKSAVNPFWSESVRKGVAGEEFPEAGGHARPLSEERRAQFGGREHGGGLSQRDMEELEEIKRKGVQDLEQRLKEELQRRGGGSTESFKSVGNQVSARGGRGVEFTPLITPPGLPGAEGLQQSGASGESLTESLRSMELPKLDESTTAVGFGDWLTVIQPMMADISSTSSRWWTMTLDCAMQAYQQWAVSSPLEKLRMKIVQNEESKKYPRTEQRAVTMILAAMPEEPRREAIAARKLSVCELLFRLFVTYQPGGQKERAALLMELADEKSNSVNGASELLRAVKAWRRNIVRTQELGVQLPDPLVLANVLAKWADGLGKLGGGQAAYRIAMLREVLDLDGRPTHEQVAEFAEVLQAESEQLVLMKNTTILAQNPQESGRKKEVVKAAALNGGASQEGSNNNNRGRTKEEVKVMARQRPSASCGGQRLAAKEESPACTFILGMASKRRVAVGTAVLKGIWNQIVLSWRRSLGRLRIKPRWQGWPERVLLKEEHQNQLIMEVVRSQRRGALHHRRRLRHLQLRRVLVGTSRRRRSSKMVEQAL